MAIPPIDDMPKITLEKDDLESFQRNRAQTGKSANKAQVDNDTPQSSSRSPSWFMFILFLALMGGGAVYWSMQQHKILVASKERISDFLQSYVFARVFLTLIIILAVLFATKYFCHWQFFAISLPMIFVSWLRAKQRAYYYAVEVLRVYFNSEMNNI